MAPRAWPFAEAERILERRPPEGGRPILFQTGYGPSGLPHIGTFAEVARTSFVRRAFEHLTGRPTRLQAFSDDMDGLRKVPQNVPNGEILAAHLGQPLSAVPDPFGRCASFADHNNGRLRRFLDEYGFDYEFKSAARAYGDGEFDEGLAILLEKVDEVLQVILPTLGPERRKGWSPFLPICPACGSVNATRVTDYHPERRTVSFVCDGDEPAARGCGESGETSILGGKAKVGWKVDWALRWFTYQVDYEMYGKDLIDSVKVSSRIVRIMGRQPPAGMTFELWLDEEGRRISKSAGRPGMTVEHWLDFAPIESLLYHIYQNPGRAKRLVWEIVPRCVDDYLEGLRRWPGLDEEGRLAHALWHIFDRGRGVPEYAGNVSYTVVLNLISALGSDDEELLKEFLQRYDPQVSASPDVLDALVRKGLAYYREQVLPGKRYRRPDDDERALLWRVRERLAAFGNGDEQALQAIPFDVAREAGREPKELFRCFYEVVLGQERGPRFGTFVALLGKERVLRILEEKTAA